MKKCNRELKLSYLKAINTESFFRLLHFDKSPLWCPNGVKTRKQEKLVENSLKINDKCDTVYG